MEGRTWSCWALGSLAPAGHRLREGDSGFLPHALSKAPWALLLTSAYPRLHPSRQF